MKKILLIIFTIILILSINVLAVDIDLGCPAIDRSSSKGPGYTWINKTNPANESGIIDTIEIYPWSDLENCEVAIFYLVAEDTLSTRDSVSLGTVTGGSKQTFSELSIDVQIGDFIGIYYTVGQLEAHTSDYDGVWYKSGDQIPCTDVTFSDYAGDALSLSGTGTTAVGWPHKWNTQTISKWNNKEFTKWNGLE